MKFVESAGNRLICQIAGFSALQILYMPIELIPRRHVQENKTYATSSFGFAIPFSAHHPEVEAQSERLPNSTQGHEMHLQPSYIWNGLLVSD